MLGSFNNFEDEFGYLDTVLEAAERHYSMSSMSEGEDDSATTSGESANNTNFVYQPQITEVATTKRLRKKQKVEIPKVMKNDIRRYFSRMFMNTINSADFINMQNFFNTFMKKDCTFVSAQTLSPVFNVPERLVAKGPRLFSHYLLGCFVMYPDMVLTMNDTRIVTSSSWAGTKVIMEVDYHLTKIYDIPYETWVPPEEAVEDMYKAPNFKAIIEATQPNAEQTADATDLLASQILTKEYKSAIGKKRRCRSKAAFDLQAVQHIPESYIKHLNEGAVLLKNPQRLRVKGQFTVFLDESNHVQLINLSGIQL